MSELYKRKKMPEQTQQKILEIAIQRIALSGVDGMSLQYVANQAGITKGGLLHHFPNKESLVRATIEHALSIIDTVLDRHIEQDPVAYGCLTRAYLYITLNKTVDIAPFWNAFSMVMLTDQTFSDLWHDWFEARLVQHENTDGAIELQIVRYAADGLWLTQFIGKKDQADLIELKKQLIKRTYLA